MLPHPAPTLAMTTYGADAGMCMFYGLLLAIPMVILSGPVFTHFALKVFPDLRRQDYRQMQTKENEQETTRQNMPSFAMSMLTILLPPILMMFKTLAKGYVEPGTVPAELLNTIGDPIVSLLIAALIRIAIGSATVAVVTTAGIVAPLASHSGVNLELLVLATSTGGLMLSHVNDSGFWLFKEYFQLTVAETLKSWTLLVSFLSVLGLIFVLLLNALVG
jgi:H+/gluconate symporter-like permease